MAVDMYVVDSQAYKLVQRPEPRGNRIASMVTGPQEDMFRVAEWILHYKLPGEKIALLRVFAHGDAGQVALGKGLDVNTAHDWCILKGHFLAGGRIELHACGVASSTSVVLSTDAEGNPTATRPGTRTSGGMGDHFLKKLAQITGAIVTGGINEQKAWTPWGGGWSFEGPTVTAYPPARRR